MDLTHEQARAAPQRPLALIAGIGEGLGVSLAQTFAAAGYDIAGIARTDRLADQIAARVHKSAGTYSHHVCDITQVEAVRAAVGPIAGQVRVLVLNAATLLIRPFAAITPEEFEAVWRAGCLGAMIVAHAVAPAMAARRDGTIIFTGATAGIRGGARFSAFASAKFALRGLAQALARELDPHGIHVAHVTIDGLIDAPQTVQRFGPADGRRMDPDAIAGAYLALARQHRSAWSHEIDLRPQSQSF